MNQHVFPEPQDVSATLGLDRGTSNRRWLKRVVWLTVVACAALGLWWFFLAGSSQAPALSYETADASQGKLTVTVTATGAIQPLTKVDVSTELSGVVREVKVKDNDLVAQGAVLALLDTTRLQGQRARTLAQLEGAKARLLTADASLVEADLTLKRQLTQRIRGLSNDQDYESATALQARAAAGVSAAQAELKVAEAELQLVETDIAKSQILSPIQGLIMKRSVEPGQTVASSLQAPVLFTIAEDLTRIRLEAAVDEADIGTVKAGQKAIFTVDAYRGRDFPAVIDQLSFAPETIDGVVTYKTLLSATNADLALRPGMTATARIVVAEFEDALTVPNEAFRFQPPRVEQSQGFSITSLFLPRFPRADRGRRSQNADGTRTLYVLRDDKAIEVKVKTGATDGKRTIILEGEIKSGDKLILAARQQGAR